MTRPTMHVEKSRSWWSGTSTTLCGLTIKVEKSGYWWTGTRVTCAACQSIERQGGGR